MCLQVSIAFALVLRLCLHLHCTYVCIGVAMLLALQWCCTWVAPVPVCFVPSEFREETLKNLHLLWHLLAVVCVGRCCWLPSIWFPLASLGTASSRAALLGTFCNCTCLHFSCGMIADVWQSNRRGIVIAAAALAARSVWCLALLAGVVLARNPSWLHSEAGCSLD